MADFDREPCFWTSTIPGYNTKDRNRSTMRNGVRIVEKMPQRGHAGDYEDRRPAAGTRFVRLVDHYGHEIFHTLTNAAAHMDHTSPFGQYQMAKARALGWFMPGSCPCALLATGELKPNQIASAEVRSGSPCASGSYSYEAPCKHSLAEQAARRANNDAVQAAREVAFQSKEEKMLEAMRDQTAALTNAVAASNRPAGKKSDS